MIKRKVEVQARPGAKISSPALLGCAAMDDDAQKDNPANGEAQAWSVLAYVISGPLIYGGLGWFLDRWLGTQPYLVLAGLLGGMALAFYLVWKRLSAPPPNPHTSDPGRDHE
jgi:F0F1-type ATP synthase assembly protein I